MQVVYNNKNGDVLALISDIQKPRDYKNIPQEDISVLNTERNLGSNIRHYKVKNNEITKRSDEEINEMNRYGKALTGEERFDIQKTEKINGSKSQLVAYLETHPLQFTDGKYYSVTQEKQNLLNNAITVYQMKTQLELPAELKWNATGEECAIWILEDIIALALAIANYVEPLVIYQQAIEVQIKQCTTKEELESIVIDYATV